MHDIIKQAITFQAKNAGVFSTRHDFRILENHNTADLIDAVVTSKDPLANVPMYAGNSTDYTITMGNCIFKVLVNNKINEITKVERVK